MRIRHKPWAKPELEACTFYIAQPQEHKGCWNSVFPDSQKPLYLELGCGKGGFISQAAPAHPEINFIAMDIKNEMLVLAKRKLESAYSERGTAPENVRIAIQNIERGTKTTMLTGYILISATHGLRKSIRKDDSHIQGSC